MPVWLDVIDTCPEDGYHVGADGRDVKTREFQFPFAGKLLLAGGHLHDGGALLRVYRKDTGEDLLRFVPTYTTGRQIEAIELTTFDEPLPIDPGVTYVVESVYENEMPHGLMAMGIIVAFVAPDEPERVPELPQIR